MAKGQAGAQAGPREAAGQEEVLTVRGARRVSAGGLAVRDGRA